MTEPPTPRQLLQATLGALFAERRRLQAVLDRGRASRRRDMPYALNNRLYREIREIEERLRAVRAQIDRLNSEAA